MASWREDSDRLRQRIKEGGGTTLVYALLSHMRGKLHMRWYNKYAGGWRSSKYVPGADEVIPPEIHAAYGESAKYFYGRCVIRNLEDQAEWIRQYGMEKWSDLADRVIDGYVEEDAPLAQLAEHSA